MRPRIHAALAVLFVMAAALVAFSTPAAATGPSFSSCPNLEGWYANPDEQDKLPEATTAGLKFEGKDLIHRAVPGGGIDLADMNGVSYTFSASTPDKVVFKVETSSPYSTIVTTPEGKLWSTAMTYEQIGGQGNPVEKYSDLVGRPTKPGKAEFSASSRVATFGVGYWTEDGSTVVSSISFHGKTYALTCVPVTASPSTSTSATPRPSTSTSAAPATGDDEDTPAVPGESLPVTGPSMGLIVGLGLLALAGGGAALLLARRRKTDFQA